MNKKRQIIRLGSRGKSASRRKRSRRKNGITQEEWDLRNVNPYDLLQVHSFMKKLEKRKR